MMKLYMVLMIAVLMVSKSHQEEKEEEGGEGDFLKTCSIRYNMKKFLNETTCQHVYMYNPVCNKTLTVSYSSFPPYVYTNETGQVDGILPAFFRTYMIDTCCLGCSKIRYLPEKGFSEKFYDHYVKDGEVHQHRIAADIIIPVQNHLGAKAFFNSPYATLMQVDKIYYIGIKKKRQPTDKMSSLFRSLLGTWPLLVMALSMAVGAGSVVWVLDTWQNKHQFPRHFPSGMFEGIWWSFVSMTTVGYGDRTPSSIAARIFAVVWIFIGISIFNMYTGTITSVMTANLQMKIPYSVQDKLVGVLVHTNAPLQNIIEQRARWKTYESVEKMATDLKDGKIFAIAMDEMMSLYYLPKIQEIYSEAKVAMKISIQSAEIKHGIGLMTEDLRITQMTGSFYLNNLDNIPAIWEQTILRSMENKPDDYLSGYKSTELTEEDGREILFTYQHLSFPIILASMFVLSCVCLVIKKFADKKVRRRKMSTATAMK